MTKLTPAKCYGSFDIPSLTFSYPSRPTDQILSISAKRPVHIASHEPTFILGASGSGKSTLGQLLLGMYNPTSGQILLDDQPIHLLSPSYLKQHILLLPQQAPLFPTTLLANLTLGLTPAPTQKQIEEACRIAMMTEFIKDLPEGLDTVLGGSGSAGCNLSGGQRQRLGVARAVLRDPQVLIIGM
jgi:ATP-binding cassette subfamily B (MDR/TAP) protein 1